MDSTASTFNYKQKLMERKEQQLLNYLRSNKRPVSLQTIGTYFDMTHRPDWKNTLGDMLKGLIDHGHVFFVFDGYVANKKNSHQDQTVIIF